LSMIPAIALFCLLIYRFYCCYKLHFDNFYLLR